MTIFGLKFKLEIMNMILQMISIIKEVLQKDKEKLSDVFGYQASCHK